MCVLVPEKLLGKEPVAVDVPHPYIAVKLPQFFCAVVGGRVRCKCAGLLQAVVELHYEHPVGKAPMRLARLLEHQPQRCCDMITCITRIGNQGRHVDGAHRRECLGVGRDGYSLPLVVGAGTGQSRDNGCRNHKRQEPHSRYTFDIPHLPRGLFASTLSN